MDNNLPATTENLHYIWNPSKQMFDVLDLTTGKMLEAVKYEPSSYEYSLQTADVICDLLRTGKTLTEVLKAPNMPSTTRFYAWLALYPELRIRYEQARKQRAMSFHDRALDIALSLPDKDMVPACKLAIDTLKWAAEKADPDSFAKPKESGDTGRGGVTIHLHTGVLDREAPKDIVVDKFGNFQGFGGVQIEDDGKPEDVVVVELSKDRFKEYEGDTDADNE